MKLCEVTLTGADDQTSPLRLVELSKQYPFVEWGILVSEKQSGCPRFPSDLWQENFVVAVRDAGHPVNVSCHVCGSWVRSLLVGDDQLLLDGSPPILQVCQ